MHRWAVFLAGMLALAGGLLSNGAAFAQTAATGKASSDLPRVMIVLDSSGSMWGRIADVEKVLIARQSLGALFQSWDPRIDLGISVYGHRSQGNCTDIQTIVPPGRLKVRQARAAIAKVRPYGMTPLTRAVRLAAEQLGYRKRRTSVILLTDGADNCAGDPCALAARLEREGKDFTAHVVAFSTRPDAETALQCLARKTGGQFHRAADGESLTKALMSIKDSLLAQPGSKITETVALEPAAPPPAKPQEPGQTPAPSAVESLEKQTVSDKTAPPGKAAPEKSAPKTASNTGGENRASKDGGAARKTAAAKAPAAPAPAQAAAPAPENRTARAGTEKDAHKKEAHKQAAAATSRTKAEDAPRKKESAKRPGTVEAPGTLVLRALMGADALPVRRGLKWQIFRIADQGAPQKAGQADRPVSASQAPMPRLKLPAGTYQVRLRAGRAKVSRQLVVKSGAEHVQEFFLPTVLLRLSAVLKPGARPLSRGLRWDVFAADVKGAKGAKGAAQPVAGSYDPQAGFALLPGTYRLRVQRGFVTREQVLTLDPGKPLVREIDLRAGMVRLSAWDTGGAALKSGLRWDVFAMDGEGDGKGEGARRLAGRAHGASPILTLAEGRYKVAVSAGGSRAEQVITIRAGDVRNLKITLP